MITPFPAGGLFNRSTMNAKLEEIGGAITEAGWQLIQILDNTGPMSGTWTAPDFFGDGSSYDLGVYEIGGGGSGAVSNGYFSGGGASGHGKNFIVNNVVSGTQYSYVIGAGGAGKTGSNVDGNAGGSTSFNNIEAEGGGPGRYGATDEDGADGGQGGDCVYGSVNDNLARDLFGCCNTIGYNGYRCGISQSPRDGQNQFDVTMISLCAGGWAYQRRSDMFFQTINPMPDGTKGGNGSTSITGNNATGHGNGGGGTSYQGINAISGSGSDGAIYLYARRSQEVTA